MAPRARKTLKKPAAAAKTDKVPKMSSPGFDPSLQTVAEPFSLQSFAEGMMTEMRLSHSLAAPCLRVVTACSGPLCRNTNQGLQVARGLTCENMD